MIIDSLKNLDLYVGLNQLFERAFNFLKLTDLETAECGILHLQGDDVWVNITQAEPKSQAEALLETHDQYIDIQVPLTHTERMGYAPRVLLPPAAYDAARDIAFYEAPAGNYLEVEPGMFVIFFPGDAHAPAITDTPLKKVIVKVKATPCK
jgi:YhcH/YjgK/YiaL family protein